eukprot:Hpha_TRINITY_DN14761_c0_g1::TRINITY_DN14761_c0_g1_i2::g.102802::m.102802
MSNEVKLNVYDLTGANALLARCGVGAYHSAVEVYGIEISFGGGADGSCGIGTCPPRGAGFCEFKEDVDLGRTRFSREQVVQLCGKLKEAWPAVGYDLVRRNCNHFAAEFARLLGVSAPPSWVNRLSETPWLARRVIPDRRPEELRRQAAQRPPEDAGAPQNPWTIGAEEYSKAVLEGRMK